MNDRTPPNDLGAERAAIGICLANGKIPDPLTILRPADFYDPRHAAIWYALEWLLKQGRPCDASAVNARLIETKRLHEAALLPELMGEGFAVDAGNVALIVSDRAGRRHIIAETTRTLQDAYDSSDPYESILERAESRLAHVPAADSGNVDSLLTLDEFLGESIPEPAWVLNGYLARGERLVITGTEGLGKTTLIRQLGICAAAGIDPFTGSRTQPMTVLAVDAENPRWIAQKRYSELRQAVNAHGSVIATNRFWLEMRPEGMDLGDPADVRWLQRRVKVVRPDLLVIGPAYKLHVAGNDDKDETIARMVTGVLDRIRAEANCALVLEHHAGNEQGGTRPIRPYGSSLWRRWPEFGFGIRPAKAPRGMDPQEAERRRLVDFAPWRGSRDERAWPRQMESGGIGLPWVESVVEAA